MYSHSEATVIMQFEQIAVAYIVSVHLGSNSEYEVFEVGFLEHTVIFWGVLISELSQLLGGATENLCPCVLEAGQPLIRGEVRRVHLHIV